MDAVVVTTTVPVIWASRPGLAELNDPEAHGPVTLVTMRDPFVAPFTAPEGLDVRRRLDLVFHDMAAPALGGLTGPQASDASQIVTVLREARAQGWGVVAACEFGWGRSHAVAAAHHRLLGVSEEDVWVRILQHGTYNRRLYRLICAAIDVPVREDPLVSVVVRVKYPEDRLSAFLLSLERQRWTNWECIAVTDGPRPEIDWYATSRVRVIQTPVAKGRWGHPYRQLGIDAAHGEYLCLQNDDNYLTPGMLEQLASVLLFKDADLVVTSMVHSYFGWAAFEPGPSQVDVGAWMARRELVQQVPWTGMDAVADVQYVSALVKAATRPVMQVNRCLFVHN